MSFLWKNQRIRLWFSAAATLTAVLILSMVFGGTGSEAEAPTAGDESVPSAEVIQQIAVSMGKEQENSYVTSYLEQDPYLTNIYEGYGFAIDYGSARGHYYTLEDVKKTQRPHAKANCITCKTPDMHKMIAEQGISVYSMPFDEVMAQMTQPISCYTCHGADDGNSGRIVITHQYVNEALGENVSQVKAASLACGQCHIEYYFTPEDSEAMMPYHSVEEMAPEAILAYYDSMDFYDWEQPGTGTKMLKAQHPELENWSLGKHAGLMSCADCHMETAQTESGEAYHDHHLISPLNSETVLAKCAACHGSAENTIALVKSIQENITGREIEVGNRLSELKDALTAAAASDQMNEEELDKVRKLHREAQWFFDFCYVENSEGAHNSALSTRCLDTSAAKIEEAMWLLNPDSAAAAGKAASPFAGFRITKQTPYSTITVILYMRNGVIKDCRIFSEGEQDLLTGSIRKAWARSIVEKGDADTDAISGATLTVSADAVREAVNETLSGITGK